MELTGGVIWVTPWTEPIPWRWQGVFCECDKLLTERYKDREAQEYWCSRQCLTCYKLEPHTVYAIYECLWCDEEYCLYAQEIKSVTKCSKCLGGRYLDIRPRKPPTIEDALSDMELSFDF